jgi:hypothetical protein
MKKKRLLLVFLALAIVTSLTAGTLAIYTKSIDLTGKVEAKKFAFTATGGYENSAQSINLAPTEAQNYLFVVTNKEGTSIAEVDLKYTVSIDFAAAAAAMPGLTATLYEKAGTDTSYTQVATVGATAGIITYSSTTAKNTATEHDYKLTLTWSGNDNGAQTTAGANKVSLTSGLNIKVAAEQAV